MLRIGQPNQSTCPAHLGLHGNNRNDFDRDVTIDIKRKYILLRACYVPTTSATCPAHLRLHGKNRNGPVCAILPKVAKVRRRGWQILQHFCSKTKNFPNVLAVLITNFDRDPTIDIKRKYILLRACYVPNTSATCPTHLGLHGKNRNGPVCVILSKVANFVQKQKLPKCIGSFNYEFW